MKTVRSIISLIFSQLLVNTLSSIQPSKSIQFDYPSFNNTNLFNIDLVYQDSWYQGQNATYGDSSLLLSPDPTSVRTYKYSNIGKCKYKDPILFKDNQSSSPHKVVSFNTSFTFQIITTAPYGLAGSGMAFFISAFDKAPMHSDGRFLGLLDPNATTKSKFFAVEFDTHTSTDLNDTSASHIGIDINSLVSRNFTDTSPNSTSSFFPELYLYSNYTFMAWIDYNSYTNLIQVWMTNHSSSKRPPTACVQLSYDLSDVFEDSMYIGFSATNKAGEDGMEGHAVYSWSFASEDIIPKKTTKKHSNLILPIAIALSILIALGALGLAWYCFFNKRQKRRTGHIPSSVRTRGENSVIQLGSGHGTLLRYSYRELKRSARGFTDKVGEGGFSSVYRATLADGSIVAIKRLKEGVRKEAEFSAEMNIIISLRHRNLLELRGWCYEKGEAMLVYKYMSNGSLESYLYGKRQREVLQSETRLKILVGVASALEYLHGNLGECVLHRDVKAANVLLTEDFEPRLGDFGLARLIAHNEGAVTMTAVGTPGYVAPEVIDTGRFTDKADVYSFGILSLEMAYGRPAIAHSWEQPEEAKLINYVWMLHQKNQLMEALDPCMSMDTTQKEQWRCVVHVALMCCNPSPTARPTMRQVFQALKGDTMLLTQPLPATRPLYTTSPNWLSASASASSASFTRWSMSVSPSETGSNSCATAK